MAAINIIKCDRRPFWVKVIWLMWAANTWIDNITDSPIPTKFRTGWIRGKRELTWKYIFARSWHVFASSELGVAWSTAFTLWCSHYVGTILFSTVSWLTSCTFEQEAEISIVIFIAFPLLLLFPSRVKLKSESICTDQCFSPLPVIHWTKLLPWPRWPMPPSSTSSSTSSQKPP